MALTKAQLLDEIDNMAIYSRDRDVIEKLLTLPAETFSTIVENVVLGHLYWSDFEVILGHTNYHELVSDILDKQERMKRELININAAKAVNSDDDYPLNGIDYTTTVIGIPEDPMSLNPDENERLEPVRDVYNLELANIKDEILYELTKITPEDNSVTLLVKLKLYELLNKPDLKEILNSTNLTASEVTDEIENAITIDDIFFFIDTYTIPVAISYQTLTTADRQFMLDNNLNESDMMKMKSLMTVIRRGKYINEYSELTQGGDNGSDE